jgi:Ca2+/Na+ antiporter
LKGGDAADIGIGSLLGSGMFVTTVVLALVAFQSDGRLKRRPFVRDIIYVLSYL